MRIKEACLHELCVNGKSDIVDGPFGSNLKSEHFISEGIPSWAKNLSINSSVIWNTGIVGITTMSILIYLAKR